MMSQGPGKRGKTSKNGTDTNSSPSHVCCIPDQIIHALIKNVSKQFRHLDELTNLILLWI